MPWKVELWLKRVWDEKEFEKIKLDKNEQADALTKEELQEKVALDKSLKEELQEHKIKIEEYKKNLENLNNKDINEEEKNNEKINLEKKLAWIKDEVLVSLKKEMDMSFYVKSVPQADWTVTDVILLHDEKEGQDYIWEAYYSDEATLEKEITDIYKETLDTNLWSDLWISDEFSVDLVEDTKKYTIEEDLNWLKDVVVKEEVWESALDVKTTALVQGVIDFTKNYNPAKSPKRMWTAVKFIKSIAWIGQALIASFKSMWWSELAATLGFWTMNWTMSKMEELIALVWIEEKNEITIPEWYENLKSWDFDLEKWLFPKDFWTKKDEYLSNYIDKDYLLDSKKIDDEIKESSPSKTRIKTIFWPTIKNISTKIWVEEELLEADIVYQLSHKNDKLSMISHVPWEIDSTWWWGKTIDLNWEKEPYVDWWNEWLVLRAKFLKSYSEINSDLTLNEKILSLWEENNEEDTKMLTEMFEKEETSGETE